MWVCGSLWRGQPSVCRQGLLLSWVGGAVVSNDQTPQTFPSLYSRWSLCQRACGAQWKAFNDTGSSRLSSAALPNNTLEPKPCSSLWQPLGLRQQDKTHTPSSEPQPPPWELYRWQSEEEYLTSHKSAKMKQITLKAQRQASNASSCPGYFSS